MAIWKKQLHIALVFILVFSLFSPTSVSKAQHFAGELDELNTENANDISDSNLDNSIEQDNATKPDNEIELEDSTELDNALESDNEAELEQQTQIDDAAELTVTPLMEIPPLTVSDIQLNVEEPLLLQVAETFELTATTSTTEDSASIVWASSNSGVATVDNGLVTAKAIGEAIITAQLGGESKAVTVYVISPEAQAVIDFIIALPPIESADEATYQLLLQARELESKVGAGIVRNLLRDYAKLPYLRQLLEKEVAYFKLYIQDPSNILPDLEDITLNDELNNKLDAVREKYASLIQSSGYRKVTDENILAFNEKFIEKEIKYAFLTINTLPPLENIAYNPAIKEQLEHARKKVKVLSTNNQKKVTNHEDLVNKEIRYLELFIDAIDINDLLAKELVAEAEKIWKALPNIYPNAKVDGVSTKGVANYPLLLDKKKMLSADDDIKAVIAKIDALPSIEMLVWADILKVAEVQLAYDKLLTIHKNQVTNYDKLEALQKRLLDLQPSTVEAYNAVAGYLTAGSYKPAYNSEWSILTLARGDYNLEKYATYYEQYYQNIVSHVKATNGEIDKQASDWARVIIALTAIGKDPRDVAGFNLVEKLEDLNFVNSQGVNGTIYSLIALDTWNFELSPTATTTRDKLIQSILSKELKNGGGFAWSGTTADPDMTGMVLQALAPYQNQPNVRAVIDRSITKLIDVQTTNGGFISTAGTPEAAESVAQVITALASLGIDANKDERFNKIIDNAMSFSTGDGGFKHVHSQTNANGMATVQVGYSLAAYNRLLSGQTALYDMSDTKDRPSTPEDGDDDEEPSPPDNNGNQPSVPSDKEPIGYATVSIRISSSEVPLKPTATKVFAGETAFDALKRATDDNGIALSYRQTELGVYIDGIAGLYEFDRGPLSGWMYRVNGVFPSYSAASYVLSPNDVVEWVYTIDLGKDTGGYVDGIENGAGGAVGDATCAEGDTECIAKLCPEGDELCIAEHTVPKTDTEQPQNNTVVEITIEGNENKALITQENLQQYREKNIQKLIIQSDDNFKLEIPMSTFNTMTLADGEQISASVTKDIDNKQFTVSFGIETAQGRVKPISLGNEYLKVTLPAKDVKANSVVLQLVGGAYKPVPHQVVNGEIVVFTKTSGTFVIAERSVTFNDIAHLANKDEIEFLANRLVIQGTTPETFEPNKPITRAQFAALISRSLGLQSTGENPFSDTQGKWYELDIQALFEAGITKGTTASTFNPEAPITRQQAAAFMARILDYVKADVKANGQVDFTDSSNINPEYLPYIELLNSLDIMTGKENGSFDPDASLTRGQTAKILKRTLTIVGMM